MKNEYQRRIDVRGVTASGVAGQSVVYVGGGGNADQVDGIDADRVPRAGRLLALNEKSQFPASVFPTPSGDAVMGWGGRTIFGPHVTHLAEAIDAVQTTYYVREPLLEVDEFLTLQPPIGDGEKMKVLAGPTLVALYRYAYTVDRNVDGKGAHSFPAGTTVTSIAKAGQGYIAIDAQAGQAHRPFIDIIERTADDVAATAIRARFGKLDGLTENHVDNDLKPRGWGIWTDNGYFRGLLRVMGDSRINGSLTVGQYPGPGWTAGVVKNEAVNDAYVEQLRDEHGAPWFTRRYDTDSRHVTMEILNPSLKQVLVALHWRSPNTGIGETGVARYFLDIDASTLIGEAIAGRFRVLGELSALSADFGEAQTSALVVAAQAYDSKRRGGLYAWNLPESSPYWKKYAPAGHTGLTRGFEIWKTTGAGTGPDPFVETRHGYIDFPNGRFVWGATDDVWLSGEGVTMAANVLSDASVILSPAAVRRALTWYNATGDSYDAMLAQTTASILFGGGGMARSSYLSVDQGNRTSDFGQIGLGFHHLEGGYLQYQLPFLLTRTAQGRTELVMSSLNYLGLPGLAFTSVNQGVSWWQAVFGCGLDLTAAALKPPEVLDGLDDGEFGGGLNTGYKIVAARGFTGGPVQLGIDDASDPGNPRLMVKIGGTWFWLNLNMEQAPPP